LKKIPQEGKDVLNDAGSSPMHWAALNGHLPATKLLLDFGANPQVI